MKLMKQFQRLREEAGAGGDAGGGEAAWHDSLSEEVRGIEGASDILGQYKSIDEAAKGLINTKQAYGKATEGMVKLPGEGATPEDIAAYHKAVGVPDAADGYSWKAPEGMDLDQEAFGEVAKSFHEAGYNDAQYAKAMDAYVGAEQAREAMFAATQEQMAEESTKALKEEWGADYDKNIAETKAFAEKAGVYDVLKGYGAINEKAVLDVLYAAAVASREDGVDDSGNGSTSKDEQLAALKSSEAYNSKTHPDHRKAIEQAMSLRG
jgi:post-segregation antitoxin (ccd killing protein)